MFDTRNAITELVEPLRSAEGELDRRFPELRPSLLRVSASLVGADEAEDVVHDTYLRARKTIRQLRDFGAMEAWLYRIAINVCYSRHRRWSRARVAERGGMPGTAAGPDLDLRDLIVRLPDRERVILVLHYGHGYGLDEIAEVLGIKHATVRSIIARTRHVLHRQLTEGGL